MCIWYSSWWRLLMNYKLLFMAIWSMRIYVAETYVSTATDLCPVWLPEQRLDTFQRPMQHQGIWKPRMPRQRHFQPNSPAICVQRWGYNGLYSYAMPLYHGRPQNIHGRYMSLWSPSSTKSLDDGLCFRSLVCILLDSVEDGTILSICQSSDLLQMNVEF